MPATLTSVRIQNLALVEDLEWKIPPGFVAVTGETGSGKSIIIGALNLLLGERADKSLIRTGAENCVVEAVFGIEDTAEIEARLDERGIERCTDSELIIKRTLSHSGASRQFINCCATTLAVLKEIGDSLIDLHGPHDHQSLLSPANQLGLLDGFAHAAGLAAEHTSLFRKRAALISERDQLSSDEAALEREKDLLIHQSREIEGAALEAGEEEELLTRYKVAANGKRLAELASGIIASLTEADDTILTRLAEVQRLFRELGKIDSGIERLAEANAGAITQLEENARDLQAYFDRIEIDSQQLAQIEERVTLIETLKRKYGASLAVVIAFGENAADRLRKIESRGDELNRLAAEIDAAENALRDCAARLSQKRTEAAPKLAKKIRSHLEDLGFKKCDFKIQLTVLEHSGPTGADAIEFLFAPNPGEPLQAMRATASSGEISRVMLAVKTALAEHDKIPLLVFDEIDQNVGGEIAHAVGAKMKSLGTNHQVICITHLAQVAAAAEAQFAVTKEFRNERTISGIRELQAKARVEEIARMLGGASGSAIAHAKTLLSSPGFTPAR